jgi:hypothetical protein
MQFVARARLVLRPGSLCRDKNPSADKVPLRNYTLRIFLSATIISRHRTARIGNAMPRGAFCFGR